MTAGAASAVGRRGRGRAARRAGAAALAATALVAGCTGSTTDEAGTPDEPTSSQSAGAGGGEADEALAVYYDQELDFGSCVGRAASTVQEAVFVDPFECAWLTVPLDYSDPAGDTATIGVLRLPADGEPGQRIGSLVVNPGGPGGTGMAAGATASAAWAETEIPLHFDVVGFDPRGVGATEPTIDCFDDAEQDRGENKVTLLGTSGEWSEQDTQALVQQCSERSGGPAALSAVGTRDVARDLDVLRGALGDEQLTFAGQSYGTRLGAVYAEMFPDRVRAMVLDGALDPRLGTAERRVALHTQFQRSFDLMAASCAQRGSDCPLGTDPGGATAAFQDLVQPLLDEPVPAGDDRALDFAGATGAVTAGLYSSAQWPAVIDGITQLRSEGRGDLLLALADQAGGRTEDGRWDNQVEANFAINCMDEQRRTPEEEAELRQQIEEVAPYGATGRPLTDVSRDACEAWPSEPTLEHPYAQDVDGLPPTLVISITGDAVTPYEAGVSLADSMGGAPLTVEGEQHTVAQAGSSACVNDVVTAYLVDLEVPAEDSTCAL